MLRPKAVGQPAFFHDLQQHVEDVGMSFFDFVQQHDRVGTTTNFFGQLTAFFVADVSGRGTDQTAEIVFLHVLGHVDRDQRVFVAEHEFGQCFGKQRLTDTGRTGKHEATDRARGIFQSTATAANGFGDRLDGRILADDFLVQFVFHLHQTHRVFGRQSRQRNARHFGNDFGDDFFVDDAVGLLRFLTPFAFDLLFFLAKFVGLIAQAGCFFEILIGNRVFFFLVQTLDVFVDFFQIWWTAHGTKPDAGTCFVDHVDRFVGQAATGDVTTGQIDGGGDRVVGDLHAVVFFVSFAQSLEDFDRFFVRGRIDNDFLETSGQRVVFFDVLAILVQRRGTDALDFAAGQSRFQYVGGVDGTFGTAGTDQRVQFVDEQDRVLRATNFVHDGLDSFFELTAVLRAGDHHRQVEHDDSFVGQDFRNFAGDDQLGKSFDDRRFADAGFTEQDRVVFGSSAKDLDGSFDFLMRDR